MGLYFVACTVWSQDEVSGDIVKELNQWFELASGWSNLPNTKEALEIGSKSSICIWIDKPYFLLRVPFRVLVLLPPGLCNLRHHQKWGKFPYLYVRSKVYENISNFGSGCASPAFWFLLSIVVHKLLKQWYHSHRGALTGLPEGCIDLVT